MAWNFEGDSLVKFRISDEIIQASDEAIEINPQDPDALEGKEALPKQKK